MNMADGTMALLVGRTVRSVGELDGHICGYAIHCDNGLTVYQWVDDDGEFNVSTEDPRTVVDDEPIHPRVFPGIPQDFIVQFAYDNGMVIVPAEHLSVQCMRACIAIEEAGMGDQLIDSWNTYRSR